MFRSRFLSVFFITIFSFALAACSGSKPESVVETFYSAAEDGDVEKATSLISFANVPAPQMVAAKGKVQMIVGEMQSRIQANEGLKDVEIVESKVSEDGKTSTLRAKLKFKNGKEQIENHRLVKEDGDWKIVLR